MFESKEMEQAIIGAMLINNSIIPEVLGVIDKNVFFSSHHKKIFQTILELYERDGAVDMVTLAETKVTKASYLSLLYNIPPASNYGVIYARKLLKLAVLRRSIEFAEDAKRLAKEKPEDVDGYVSYLITAAEGLKQKYDSDVYLSANILDDIKKEIEGNQHKDYIGIPTGIGRIDDLTGGIQWGHLWIVGAYTSIGKTAFALQIALNVMEAGYSVVYLSNEMTAVQTGLRMLGNMSQIPSLKLQHGRYLTQEEFSKYQQAQEKFRSYDFTVVENVFSLDKILANIKLHEDKSLLIVDYIGQIQAMGKSEYEQMSNISKALQASAKNNKVPIMALSQVSNEAAKTNNQVFGYKGSGTIAAVADVGIELYRDKENEPDLLKVNLKKNRHGATGFFDLLFNIKTGEIG